MLVFGGVIGALVDSLWDSQQGELRSDRYKWAGRKTCLPWEGSDFIGKSSIPQGFSK